MPPRRATCANPLLLQWLEELRDEFEFGENMYNVYSKAYKSIRTYPHVFAQPKDALPVPFIGEKTVKALEKKMRQAGLTSLLSGGAMAAPTVAPLPKTPAKPRGRPKKSNAEASASASTPSHSSPPQTHSRPRLMSNPSAPALPPPMLHVTQFLFTYLDFEGNPLPDQTDAHIDLEAVHAGFRIQFPVTCQHAAVHHVVNKQQYLQNYFAVLPFEVEESFGFKHSTWDPRQPIPNTGPLRAPPTLVSSSARLPSSQASGRIAQETPLITREAPPAPSRTPSMSSPKRSVDIANALSEEQRNKKSRTLDPTRNVDHTIPRTSNYTHMRPSSSNSVQPSAPTSAQSRLSSLNTTGSASTHSQAARTSQTQPLMRAQTMNNMPPPALPPSRVLNRTASAPIPAPARQGGRPRPRLSYALPTLPPSDVDFKDLYMTNDPLDLPEFEPVIIPKDSFEIVMLLDQREVKSRSDPEAICRALLKKGVNVERRTLLLGDVSWIARRLQPHGDEYDEISLSVILERKRLDDLVASITEHRSRFTIQKFRLHNTAMEKVYYVVEDYKSQNGKRDWTLQINTAVTSTQIFDNFFLHETASLDETILRYKTLHKVVLNDYLSNDLTVIPSHLIKRYNYLRLQKTLRAHGNTRYLTSYGRFEFLNDIKKSRTIREVWAHMLLTVNGVSAEKASAIIAEYPTPKSLRDAFMHADTVEAEDRALQEEENASSPGKKKKKSVVREARYMLQDIGQQSTRSVGKALSSKIYEVFMQRENFEG